MAELEIVGLSISIVDDQRLVWADEQQGIKATPETVYRAGSITKLFTATAAIQLAERGKLDIDQPLERYLPGFSIKSRFQGEDPITPRNIMTHHSGQPTDYLHGIWAKRADSFTDRVLPPLAEDLQSLPGYYSTPFGTVRITQAGNRFKVQVGGEK
ncbi:MAG: serine hydrolase domain-containing protein [Desulfobacteraceae bacterium]|jgi:CubicO group peptidase (beta-lactamase class C family)